MTRAEIVSKYLGVPFKNGGRTLDGLDCYGLVVCIFADRKITLVDAEKPYDTKWSFKGENYLIENAWRDWVEVVNPRILDLICFDNSNGVGYHIGVCFGDGSFIHTTKAGTVISRVATCGMKIRGFYRHRGLVDG